MSENENLPPAPNKQTSSVPLMKETIRVTLKAADAPPSVPSATISSAPPVRPPVPGGIAPPTPSVAVTSAPRPSPGPAPTVPLRTTGAPIAVTPAPTIRLATSGAPASPAAPTTMLRPGGSPTLPKATVQLQAPTQPLGTSFPTSTQAATLQIEEEEEVDAKAGLHNILSVVGLIAAIVLLIFQLSIADLWISATDKPGDWMQLIQ